MKKTLMVTGIILVVIGILALIVAAFWWYAYNHTMDGSFELYRRQHKNMYIFLTVGVISELIGVLCLIFHAKI